MKSTNMPSVITNCRKTIRKYFAECLARSTEQVSLEASAQDIARATLTVFLLHYQDDISDEVESALEIAEVEVKDTPGSIVAMTCLNRFSGIDVNEHP